MKTLKRAATGLGLSLGLGALAWLASGTGARVLPVPQVSGLREDSSSKAPPAPVKGLAHNAPARAPRFRANEEARLSPKARERLSGFAKTQRKVFMSERERGEQASLLADGAFLREIAGTLESRALDPSTRLDQSEAIDALLAAQAAGTTEARALLQDVVLDAQVEDQTLAPSVRENLAGLKAEVLFRWSAVDPSVSEIASNLPGPVSRRIWANVQDQQARNLAESQTLDP